MASSPEPAEALDEVEAILAELKHVERRVRLLKRLVARYIDKNHLQSEEDTRE